MPSSYQHPFSSADLDLEDECDNESELGEELDEDEDEEKNPLDQSITGSPILVPHPRFPLGLNLPLPPPGPWNPVSNPWMPQFRSPLNPFIPSKYSMYTLQFWFQMNLKQF